MGLTVLDVLLSVLLSSTDLFQDMWTKGNLNTIGWFTGKFGYFCCCIISFVGFAIVILAIMKNAISGLYLVNHKFWDRVDDIKTQSLGFVSGEVNNLMAHVPGQGNAAAQRLGGFLTYLLQIIPNIKQLTDFDGEDGAMIDKKQWFARSIPILVFQIFVGMLIFYGYTSGIAEWVGSGGTQLLDMLLTNVDPVATITSLSDKFIVADFAYESSEDPYEKMVFSAASDGFTAVVGRVSDIKKEPRQDFAYQLESDIYEAFHEYADVIGATDGYDVSTNAVYLGKAPTRPNSWAEGSSGVWYSTASNGVITYRKSFNVANYPLGSAGKVQPDDTLVITFTASPVSLRKTSSLSGILVFNGGSVTQTPNALKIKLEFGDYKYNKDGNSTGDIVGTPMAVSIEYGPDADNIEGAISGNLEVEGTDLFVYVKGAKGSNDVEKLKANLGNIQNINFGYATSTLKVICIKDKTTKVSIPIVSMKRGTPGLLLSSQQSTDPPTPKSGLEAALKGVGGGTEGTEETN